MKLISKQISEVTFSIEDKGYSPKEVDEFLDKVIEDYKENEKSTIHISVDFDGELLPNTVSFDGTVADWIHIENKGIFKDAPCINCKDGQYIQKL